MPRQARRAPGGLIYHVLNRGVGRQDLFDDDGDFAAAPPGLGPVGQPAAGGERGGGAAAVPGARPGVRDGGVDEEDRGEAGPGPAARPRPAEEGAETEEAVIGPVPLISRRPVNLA